ncbi:uncharacterized mitochondrial protein-like protein [Tanacetum coccineum]|uniref:Uncharacterized mitochondrial protein-like protein n=1 Tax=Tanacetum coccineum TaxID=301880 RepID=A0ABQ5B211_9ASTR
MSFMGELTFFLGLQVKQRTYGIFLSQDKYVYDILKKFVYSSVKTASTPMETHKPLTKDENGTDVDVHLYRSMIGSLYLTSSRPDIIYLKVYQLWALCILKDSPLELIAYSDSDYAGASLDRKSTTGGCQFLGCRFEFLIVSISMLNPYVKKGRDTKVPQSGGPPIKVGDEVVHKELGDKWKGLATPYYASSFGADRPC